MSELPVEEQPVEEQEGSEPPVEEQEGSKPPVQEPAVPTPPLLDPPTSSGSGYVETPDGKWIQPKLLRDFELVNQDFKDRVAKCKDVQKLFTELNDELNTKLREWDYLKAFAGIGSKDKKKDKEDDDYKITVSFGEKTKEFEVKGSQTVASLRDECGSKFNIKPQTEHSKVKLFKGDIEITKKPNTAIGKGKGLEKALNVFIVPNDIITMTYTK